MNVSKVIDRLHAGEIVTGSEFDLSDAEFNEIINKFVNITNDLLKSISSIRKVTPDDRHRLREVHINERLLMSFIANTS